MNGSNLQLRPHKLLHIICRHQFIHGLHPSLIGCVTALNHLTLFSSSTYKSHYFLYTYIYFIDQVRRSHKQQSKQAMALKELKVVAEREELGVDGPVSPTGQYFNSSALSVAILAVFESDIPIDDSPAISTLENLFLPINPRFSSIMVRDEHGTQQWKRVKVKLEDHVSIPVFPPGLTCYDEQVQDYMSKIAMDQLPQSRPLWQLHIIKYPTANAAGMLVFKLHHALGDGYSLMAALFSCLQRADDPSKPLTFPSQRPKPKEESGVVMSMLGKVPQAFSMFVSTVRDFGWSILKSNLVEDEKSPVRSGNVGIEFHPITLTSVTFSLEDVRKIKAKLGGTINDVISGVIFYGTQLYIQAAGHGGKARADNLTALVLFNTRIIGSYQPLNEMIKPDAKSPWGNQFAFLHIAIPSCKDAAAADPLSFVTKTRQIIKAKRNSLAAYLTGRMMEMLRRLIGPEATARYLHATLRNTSLTISNLTGPMEQMVVAGHPMRSFYFMVVGVPQSLTITVVSYMGKLKVAMGVEQGFINPKLLVSCMENSFQRIFEAAVGRKAS